MGYIISNKLGWIRTKLTAAEPTFEKGIWKGLKFDAVQSIGYERILDWCGLSQPIGVSEFNKVY